MDLKINTTNPWLHPYYSLIKHLYHPFLFHNHLYCEMIEAKLRKLLEERDMYVNAIQRGDLCIRLINREREWIIYLRDCCLFELHRRKYKFVLVDILRITHRYHLYTRNWQEGQLPAHSKVWLWLNSNEIAYETGDYRRDIDEYPERLEDDNNPEIQDQQEILDSQNEVQYYEENQETMESSESEPEPEYYRESSIKKQKVETADKAVNVDFGDPQTTDLVPWQAREDVELEPLVSNENEEPGDLMENANPPADRYMWPNSPKELLEQYAELFEPRKVRSLGAILSESEYIQRRFERRYDLQLLAERRERAQVEFARWEEEKKQLENERKRKAEEEKQEGQQLAKRQSKSVEVLGYDFVENAIRFALQNKGRTQVQEVPCAEQATTSHDERVFITWDEIREAIDMMNDDIRRNMFRIVTTSEQVVQFDAPLSESSSYSSEASATVRHFPTRTIPLFTKKLEELPKKDDSSYIQPGTYTVPKTASNTNIKKGPFKLITVPEEEDTKKTQSAHDQISTSASPPPPVPTFNQSETESSHQPQPSLVPSRKRPASYLDDNDFDSVTSEDIQNVPDVSFNYTLTNTSPPVDIFAPLPPLMPYRDPEESSISDSDITYTLPDSEPDLTNLPLPETPDEEDENQP